MWRVRTGRRRHREVTIARPRAAPLRQDGSAIDKRVRKFFADSREARAAASGYAGVVKRGCAAVVASAAFQAGVIGAIVAVGVIEVLRVQIPEGDERQAQLLEHCSGLVLGIFTVEIALRIGAVGRKLGRYWSSRWNQFDVAIVAIR